MSQAVSSSQNAGSGRMLDRLGALVPRLDLDRIKFGVKTAIAVLIAVGVEFLFDLGAVGSAALTVMIVKSQLLGTTIEKSVLRMIGNVFGCLIGLLFIAVVEQERIAATVLFTMYSMFCCFHLQRSRFAPGWHWAYTSAGLVLLFHISNPTESFTYTAERWLEIALGIAAVTVVSSVLWPTRAGMYADVFGERTNGRHKEWLIKRISWRMQANAEGDLSERARRQAMELANDADLRVTQPRERKPAPDADQRTKTAATKVQANTDLLPGTVLKREYKGRTVHAKVLADGFEWEGERYKSLTAVAKAVIPRTHRKCIRNPFGWWAPFSAHQSRVGIDSGCSGAWNEEHFVVAHSDGKLAQTGPGVTLAFVGIHRTFLLDVLVDVCERFSGDLIILQRGVLTCCDHGEPSDWLPRSPNADCVGGFVND